MVDTQVLLGGVTMDGSGGFAEGAGMTKHVQTSLECTQAPGRRPDWDNDHDLRPRLCLLHRPHERRHQVQAHLGPVSPILYSTHYSTLPQL